MACETALGTCAGFFIARNGFEPVSAREASGKPPPGRSKASELLERLAHQEQDFLTQEFLAPVARGAVVRVRIGGVACKIGIEPRDFHGWGVFQPASYTSATLARRASLAERRAYLDLFPCVRMFACRREDPHWLACAADGGDTRIRVDGLAPVQLTEEVQPFDLLKCRYDGALFWFDEIDPRHDPGTAAWLRTALAAATLPNALDRSGLTAQERAAYELLYWREHQPITSRRPRQIASSADPAASRLRESLSHAGAELIGYLEHADGYQVTYVVAGQRYTSSVDKRDLTVHSSGICLSGRDHDFDLTSLVGVLREGQHDA